MTTTTMMRATPPPTIPAYAPIVRPALLVAASVSVGRAADVVDPKVAAPPNAVVWDGVVAAIVEDLSTEDTEDTGDTDDTDEATDACDLVEVLIVVLISSFSDSSSSCGATLCCVGRDGDEVAVGATVTTSTKVGPSCAFAVTNPAGSPSKLGG